MISTGAVMKELGITRMTLYEWIRKKIVVPIVVKQGKRTFFTFDQSQITKVKSRLKPKREAGKSLLKR